MKNFPLGGMRGHSALSVNLGLLHISETTRARKFNFYTRLDGLNTLLGYESFSAMGVRAGRNAPSVNLGFPHIWESIMARKLKFYTHSDR